MTWSWPWTELNIKHLLNQCLALYLRSIRSKFWPKTENFEVSTARIFFATSIFCLSIFCHFDILRSIFNHFDILRSIFCHFDILRSIFCVRYFAFDILSVDILRIRYFAIRYFAIRYFAISIFCVFDILRFDILLLRYSAVSIFCDFDILLSIFSVRYFAIRYFAFRYFVRNPFEHPPPPAVFSRIARKRRRAAPPGFHLPYPPSFWQLLWKFQSWVMQCQVTRSGQVTIPYKNFTVAPQLQCLR